MHFSTAAALACSVVCLVGLFKVFYVSNELSFIYCRPIGDNSEKAKQSFVVLVYNDNTVFILTIATGEGGLLTSRLTATRADTLLTGGGGAPGEVLGIGLRLTCEYKRRQ